MLAGVPSMSVPPLLDTELAVAAAGAARRARLRRRAAVAGAGGPHPRRLNRLATADPVPLEERGGVGRHALFDRLAAERAASHPGAPVRRRAGDRHLAAGVHRL